MAAVGCGSNQSLASADAFTEIGAELTTAGLPTLSQETRACLATKTAVPTDSLAVFTASLPQERDYVLAKRIAAAYVTCEDPSAQRNALIAGITDLGDTQSTDGATCRNKLDDAAVSAALTAVFITDEQRLYRSLSEFILCARREVLGASLAGRVYLAFAVTRLAPLVGEEAAECTASTLTDVSNLESVEDVLAGASGSPEAVSELSAALVPCVDQNDLASVVSVSAGVPLDCATDLTRNEQTLVVSLVAAYISQDSATAESLIGSLIARC